MTTNSTQGLYRSFAAIRILFGLVWLINTYLQLNPAYLHLFAHSLQADLVAGQPAWLQAYGAWTLHWVTIVGPALVAKVTIVLDALLAVSLITGLGLPFLAWLGFFYNLWLWSTVGGLGGPYTTGATDPGTAIIYALCFLLVIWSRSWQVWSLQPSPVRLPQAAGMETGRIVFGLLWAFDAFWKWQPYFLTHAVTYLQQALPGEPAWIVAYISFFIHVINLLGPVTFGIVAALMESIIAFSLLTGVALRWLVPVGIFYSLGVWTTAEGWGAPYLPGMTANKGDVLGTTNIYVIAFLFVGVWVYLRPRVQERSATKTAVSAPAP